MPTWIVDNNYAYLQHATAAEEDLIYENLRTRHKNYHFDYRYRIGVWDGWEYFYDRERKRILAGLLTLVAKMGVAWPIQYLTTPAALPVGDSSLKEITLTSIQEQAVAEVRNGAVRGIFDYVTGIGKTAVIVSIAKLLNVKTLVIVPGVDLQRQVHSEFARFSDLACGKLGGGHKDADQQVTIVVDDTLKKLPKGRCEALFKDVKCVIMDEVHNCTEKLIPSILACNNACYRYGFSGTPFELGSVRTAQIIGVFGDVLATATAADLVSVGRGVPADFVFVPFTLPHLADLAQSQVDDTSDLSPIYNDLYEAYIVTNAAYHNRVADLVHRHWLKDQSVLILVRRVQHGLALSKVLERRTIPHGFSCGKHSGDQREELKDRFKKGQLKVLIASDIYKEGVDIPCIDVLILAGGGTSTKDWKQRVGRVLRANPGKTKALVYDFLFESPDPRSRSAKIFVRHAKARAKEALGLGTSKVFRLDPDLDQLLPYS